MLLNKKGALYTQNHIKRIDVQIEKKNELNWNGQFYGLIRNLQRIKFHPTGKLYIHLHVQSCYKI